MSDNLILIAVRSDRNDVGLPVRGILDALGNADTPPAHVAVYEAAKVTARQLDLLRELFASERPDAFQALADFDVPSPVSPEPEEDR